LPCLLAIPAILLAGSALAERAYKWIDEDGNVQYTNRLPPEAALTERKEINEQGRIIKVYSAPPTAEEKAEAERLAEMEAKKKERAEKRAIHDRSLIATYSSKDDMLKAQENKISMVQGLVQLTHSRIRSMQERLLALTEEAASYERSGKELPFTLQHQIKNLRDQITHNKEFSLDKQAEIEEIRKQFAFDLKRYEELTSDSPPKKDTRKSALELAMNNPDLSLDRRDRTLLSTFTSEDDLLFARNEELEELDREIKQAYYDIDGLQRHLAELSDNADEYEKRGEQLPNELVGQMKDIMSEISISETKLQGKRREKLEAEQKFTSDIERFRFLISSISR
jgi:chromosome segregation ATPase